MARRNDRQGNFFFFHPVFEPDVNAGGYGEDNDHDDDFFDVVLHVEVRIAQQSSKPLLRNSGKLTPSKTMLSTQPTPPMTLKKRNLR